MALLSAFIIDGMAQLFFVFKCLSSTKSNTIKRLVSDGNSKSCLFSKGQVQITQKCATTG